MTTVILDFESRSLCDLKRAGAPRYAQDPTTEVLCLCWMVDGDRIEVWHPGEPIAATSLYAAIMAGATLVAHNAAFEKWMWHFHMIGLGWPKVPNSQWHDTLAMCAMRAIPQGLDRALQVLNLPAQKDKEGSKLTIGLSRLNKKGYLPEITPAIMATVDAYCKQDVHAQYGLHNRLGWLPPGERDVWLLDQRINERGFAIDLPLVRAMQRVVDKATLPLAEEFRALTGGLSFTQGQATKAWCAAQGFPLQDLQADTVADALGYSPDRDDDSFDVPPLDMPEPVRRALSIRQLIGSAAVKKLKSAQACVMSDGRVRGSLQYHGAGPGRWAGRLLQPHNFPRGTIFAAPEALVSAIMTEDPGYVEALFGPAVETVVSSLRHVIVAPPGGALVAGDFAGVEARITMAASGQDDKRDLLAAEVDVYCDMAAQIYGRPITKADKIERDIGKHAVLGLGFGMGAAKFHWKYGKGQTADFCKGAVAVYRKEWAPCIPKMWRGLETAAVRTVWDKRPHEAYGCVFALEDAWMTLRLPSGRKLWYCSPVPVRQAMPWDPDDIREGLAYRAQKAGKWVTVKAFGGQFTNNYAEGFARDLLTTAMFKCEREGLPIVLTVHDEIVAEGDNTELLRQLMVDTPAWARAIKVPIATECWTGPRYRK